MEVWDAARVRAGIDHAAAADALEAALRGGLDPETDPVRSRAAAAAGELLLMPSASVSWLGAKLVTVRHRDAAGPDGVAPPAVQGVYALFDGTTMAPVAVLDAAALTAVRTPAVSALAVRHLAVRPSRALVVGSGVQAAEHASALVTACGLVRVDVAARRLGAAEAVAARVRAAGAASSVTDAGDTAALADAVRVADVVVCATSAGTPLFDGALVRDDTVVVAVGSHTTTTREVDSALAARAQVVVESRASAVAEAGAVVVPIGEGLLREDDLVGLAALVRGEVAPARDRPRLFAGTGMSWQDLVVASALVSAAGLGPDGG